MSIAALDVELRQADGPVARGEDVVQARQRHGAARVALEGAGLAALNGYGIISIIIRSI